jgi:carotenoid cleavage dioxygenase
MRRTSGPSFSRRDALRMLLSASAAHAPLWLAACADGSSPAPGALYGAAGSCGPGDDPIPTAPYDPSISWYLQNEYAPTQEEHDLFELEVVGAIPAELDGTYFRNGPNYKGPDLGHKFCAQGMVHAVSVKGGRALWYRNRYIRTPFYDDPTELKLDPKGTAANTSLIYHASRLLAVAESGFPYEMSPSDLSTLGYRDYEGKLTENFTGHPKYDPITGELIGIGYGFAPPFLHHYRVDPQGNLVGNEPIDLPPRPDGLPSNICMIHDFAITSTKTIFMKLPIVLDLTRALNGEGLPFGWDESNGSALGIMPRNGRSADVVWIEIDPCWIFHVVNAYDAGPNTVILDVARHPAPFWEGSNRGLLPGIAQLARYTIDLTLRTAKLSILDDREVEFPRFDDRLMGRKHRYAYTLGLDHDKMFEGHVTGIVKYDLQQGLATTLETAPGLHLDEVMFVPASANAGEDEGYLMGFVYERQTNTSSFLIYDAQNITAPPIAQVKLPVRVPIGLHGYWLPSSALG